MDTPKNLPVLDATELRVLGSLMEKARTTPEYYPMSLNGLTAACNQKTSRKPVVQYGGHRARFIKKAGPDIYSYRWIKPCREV